MKEEAATAHADPEQENGATATPDHVDVGSSAAVGPDQAGEVVLRRLLWGEGGDSEAFRHEFTPNGYWKVSRVFSVQLALVCSQERGPPPPPPLEPESKADFFG